MPWTSQDLATLDAAIGSGVKRVHFQDRDIEYQSTKDMLIARTEIVNSLVQNGGTPQIRTVQIWTKNGW